MSIAVILGSSFREARLGGRDLDAFVVDTEHGPVELHRFPRADRKPAYVLFRHAIPHRYLPHQIPYLAHAEGLRHVGCAALLVTSSVGVLDREVPLGAPLLVGDLLMPENRLPDGRTCTRFQRPSEAQGHLVLDDGLFSTALGESLSRLALRDGVSLGAPVVFAYAGGPRTKTRAENELWARLGAQVNSMTLGPEVVLANEAGIPTAALVVGHKFSLGGRHEKTFEVEASLEDAARAMERLVVAFLEEGAPVPFANRLFRFSP